MKRHIQSAALAFAASALTAAFTGCSSSGVTPSGASYSYSFGTLTARVSHSLEQTFAASQQAIESFEFEVIEASKDAFEAKVVGEGADDEYTIELQREGDELTKVEVSVGAFGERARAEQIMARLETLLAKPGAS